MAITFHISKAVEVPRNLESKQLEGWVRVHGEYGIERLPIRIQVHEAHREDQFCVFKGFLDLGTAFPPLPVEGDFSWMMRKGKFKPTKEAEPEDFLFVGQEEILPTQRKDGVWVWPGAGYPAYERGAALCPSCRGRLKGIECPYCGCPIFLPPYTRR